MDTSCTTQLIDGDGTFKAHGLDNFIKQVKFGDCGLSYAIVAIIGAQSSGKSTLLNHLFHTSFKEMDAMKGRNQTTKGIWMARCTGIEPCTIVLDIEGTDGKERADQEGELFEKQNALFAMAVSDIVLINIGCNDIGRNNAANRPLLENVFQVMLRLFGTRKTTFMFVIRDKTSTPVEMLKDNLIEDIQKIWDSVPKARPHMHTKLIDFINIEVVALSHYVYQKEEFKEQVANLRRKFFQSTAPGGLAGDRGDVVPASGFSLSTQDIWKLIKENKDLDLPSHKAMVATVKCEEIVWEKYNSFVAEKDWIELEKAVKSDPLLSGFGKKLSSLLSNCLSSYDQDSLYYETSVRSAKRKQLEEKLTQLIQPTYQLISEHISSLTLDEFKIQLDALDEGSKLIVAQTDKKLKQLFHEPTYQMDRKYNRTFDEFRKAIDGAWQKGTHYVMAELGRIILPIYKSEIIPLWGIKEFDLAFTNALKETEKFKLVFANACKQADKFEADARDCTERFMRLFDERCKDATSEPAIWDFTNIRAKFSSDLDSYAGEVRDLNFLRFTVSKYEVKFGMALLEADVLRHLKEASDQTWPSIRIAFSRAHRKLASELSSSYKNIFSEQQKREMISNLKIYGRELVEGIAKREVQRVSDIMIDRFYHTFWYEDGHGSNIRVSTGKFDIPAIAETARSSAFNALSVLETVRLSEDEEDQEMNIPAITTAQYKLVLDQFKDRSESLILFVDIIQKRNQDFGEELKEALKSIAKAAIKTTVFVASAMS